MNNVHIKGDGLAGMLAVNLFNKYYDVTCSHEAPPFDVGVSNTLGLFKQLRGVNNPSYADLEKYNGLIKLGVSKEGFGNNNYFMSFTPPEVSVQFNSVDFINFLKDINNNVQYIDGHNISNDSIIIDCSGYANLDDNYQYIKVPVNTVLGYTYDWTYPEFQYTKLIAGKYGYISMIPTKNKCFVSYIFNNEITNEETITKELGITDYKIFNFKSYYHKNAVKDYINGNKAFFIEPFEATAVDGYLKINELILNIERYGVDKIEANNAYLYYIQEATEVVMMHYLAGSKYKNDFWLHAKDISEDYFKNKVSENFINRVLKIDKPYIETEPSYFYTDKGWEYNITNLNVKDKLSKLLLLH